MNRRTFLKDAGLLAGGLAASSMLPDSAMGAPKPQSRRAERTFNADAGRPNILVILVDQLRYPQGQFTQTLMDQAAPRLAELRGDSVSFGHHCAAANACSPSALDPADGPLHPPERHVSHQRRGTGRPGFYAEPQPGLPYLGRRSSAATTSATTPTGGASGTWRSTTPNRRTGRSAMALTTAASRAPRPTAVPAKVKASTP